MKYIPIIFPVVSITISIFSFFYLNNNPMQQSAFILSMLLGIISLGMSFMDRDAFLISISALVTVFAGFLFIISNLFFIPI